MISGWIPACAGMTIVSGMFHLMAIELAFQVRA
jgi:hypothetical protein